MHYLGGCSFERFGSAFSNKFAVLVFGNGDTLGVRFGESSRGSLSAGEHVDASLVVFSRGEDVCIGRGVSQGECFTNGSCLGLRSGSGGFSALHESIGFCKGNSNCIDGVGIDLEHHAPLYYPSLRGIQDSRTSVYASPLAAATPPCDVAVALILDLPPLPSPLE